MGFFLLPAPIQFARVPARLWSFRGSRCLISVALPSAPQGVTDESFVYTSPRGRWQGNKSCRSDRSVGCRGILPVLVIQESDRECNGVKQGHGRMLAVPYFALRR